MEEPEAAQLALDPLSRSGALEMVRRWDGVVVSSDCDTCTGGRR